MSPKRRVGVMISGRGSNMAAIVAASKRPDAPYEVVLVASNDPGAAGLDFARKAGIPVWSRSHKGLKRAEFDALVDAEMRAAGTEIIALAGYMRLLSPEFVEGWQGRILNIHPSLLPKYKGLDTHARAIEAGDAMAGCSVHVVTAELDDGPVIARAEVPILAGDGAETLAARVLVAENKLYPAALAAFAASARPRRARSSSR